MIKLMFGSIVAAVAMFITGFIYFAGPIAMVGYAQAGERESATIQAALAANLPETGTYMVPNPDSQSGTILYGKGPVATVQYNSKGFPLSSVEPMIGGFILYLIVAALMAGALSQLDRRVPDFKSRAIIVVCFSLAAAAITRLGDPIWLHHGWGYAIFSFVGDALMLIAAGLVLARWFLPKAAEMASALPVQKAEEVSRPEEISPVSGPSF